MKKCLLLACMMCFGLFVHAQIIINNNSTCPFHMTVISGSGGTSPYYPIAPGGVTILAGAYVGVWLNTNPNSMGYSDGNDYISPINASSPPWIGFPSSGAFWVNSCGWVNVTVTDLGPGSVQVDIN
ncbi:MAG: hypothetical protein ABI378_00765 [Chitinophagaceae bacterium]